MSQKHMFLNLKNNKLTSYFILFVWVHANPYVLDRAYMPVPYENFLKQIIQL